MKVFFKISIITFSSCSPENEKSYKDSPCVARIDDEIRTEFSLKGKTYEDFDIFKGKGIKELKMNIINKFPVVLVSDKKDSLKIEFFLDNRWGGYGLLCFKKDKDHFYQIDTIKKDSSIKSVIYKYYTKDYIVVFEKRIENQNKFKLLCCILTTEKQTTYELKTSDFPKIGPDINFLVDYTPQKEIELKNLYWDSERIKKETFFWKIYLCHPIFRPESYKCENY